MKKVLSLVLVLALVLGSFSMAFAAETTTQKNLSDVAGNANEGAIIVANDLGIVTGYNDGTFKPDNAVTRAEFAAMMTRALNIPESALKGFKTSAFKDVATDHWAVTYLGYCNSKGIMTGYEDGTARPNQTITVNEAMTMICRALGYTNQAKELVGAWPANYIALGQQLGLYEDVEATATTDRASAAQIVYNALSCPIKYIDADGVTRNLTDGSGDFVTMLGNNGGSEANLGEGFVLNSDAADKAVINIYGQVGQFVKAYQNSDNEIIAIDVLSTTVKGEYKASKDQFVVGDTAYVFKAGNYCFTDPAPFIVAATGNKALGNVKTSPAGIVSGKTTTEAAVNNGMFVLEDGEEYTMAVKITNKTISEVYSVVAWDRADNMMGQYEAGDLKLDKAKFTVNGKDYKFNKNTKDEIDYSAFVLEGVSSLDKIAEDNVIEIYTKDGYISKIAVGTKTIKGTCEKITKKADGVTDSKWFIDGTKYSVAAGGDKPAVGETGTAYLTYDGDIAYWSIDEATAGNFGVLVNAVDDNDVWGNTTTKVKLTTKDGKTATYDMADKATYENYGNATYPEVTTAALKGQIVKYAFNSKGEISKIQAVTNTALAGKSNGTSRIGNTEINASVVVFQNDAGDYSTIEFKNISKDFTFGATNNNAVIEKDKVVALVAAKSDLVGAETSFGIITTVGFKNNADGNSQKYIAGFKDGAAFEIFLADDTLAVSKSVAGNDCIYAINVDSDGEVDAVTAGGVATLVPTYASAGSVVLNVKKFDSANKEIKASEGGIYALTDNVVVYYYDSDEDEWTVAKTDAIGGDKKFFVVAAGKKAWDDSKYDIVVLWDAE